MAYLRYKKKSLFVQALATLPAKVRFSSSRRLWMASRLGLYQSVLNKKLIANSKRKKLVKVVAGIKRYKFEQEVAETLIQEILYDKSFRKFHKEFIKEVVHLFPDIVLQFLLDNKYYLKKDEYYYGLYLEILNRKVKEGNFLSKEQSIPDFSRINNIVDKICLISNLKVLSPSERLQKLNKILTSFNLKEVGLSVEDKGFDISNFTIIRDGFKSQKQADDLKSTNNHLSELVTIITTTFNCESTIRYCLESLINQTWKDIEIIIVDDASNDETREIIRELSETDSRIKPIYLKRNVGTFAAKSIGAKYAKGKFLTCHDSDDWAHPQRIERQVQPLLDDINLVATTSYWFRIDSEGQYYSRQFYPYFRQNPASPLFRWKKIAKEIGLWHVVRTGADSEFWERLKLVYGINSIKVIKEPLTLASHRSNSLMTSSEFGIYDKAAALSRYDYWESWRLWHIEQLHRKKAIVMPSLIEQIQSDSELFCIPVRLKVSENDLKYILANHDFS